MTVPLDVISHIVTSSSRQRSVPHKRFSLSVLCSSLRFFAVLGGSLRFFAKRNLRHFLSRSFDINRPSRRCAVRSLGLHTGGAACLLYTAGLVVSLAIANIDDRIRLQQLDADVWSDGEVRSQLARSNRLVSFPCFRVSPIETDVKLNKHLLIIRCGFY